MASGDTLCILLPTHNDFPASAPAVPISRNAILYLQFAQPGTPEVAVFRNIMPRRYGGGSITANIYWIALTAVAGNVAWDGAFERNDANDHDLDSDNFATAQTAADVATNATNGKLAVSVITWTASQIDGITAGDPFRLKLRRPAAAASEMTASAQFHSLELKEV